MTDGDASAVRTPHSNTKAMISGLCKFEGDKPGGGSSGREPCRAGWKIPKRGGGVYTHNFVGDVKSPLRDVKWPRARWRGKIAATKLVM